MSFKFISKGNIINLLNQQGKGVRNILFAKRADKKEEMIMKKLRKIAFVIMTALLFNFCGNATIMAGSILHRIDRFLC